MLPRLAVRSSLVALVATIVTWLGTPASFRGPDSEHCGPSFATLGATSGPEACADRLLWAPAPADQVAARNRSPRANGLGLELTTWARGGGARMYWRAAVPLFFPASPRAESSSPNPLDALVASGKTDLPPPLV